VLEGVLYFALGFLAAALLALMVAPAIWRRAVVLTRRRIESSVPLTLNEIQADKDQLRAEFAMSTRRLELSVEKLRSKAADQLIDINRKREELTELSDETQYKSENLSVLEAEGSDLRDQLRLREQELADVSRRYRATETALEERSGELDLLEQRFRTASSEFDGGRIELAARDTQLQNLADKMTDLNKVRIEGNKNSGQLKSEIKALKRELASESRRSKDLDKRLTKNQATLIDREEKLDRRERELVKARERSKDTSSSTSKIEEELMKIRSDKVTIEAELAKSNLHMEALLDDASNDNVEKALTQIRKEKQELKKNLQSIEGERDALKVELSAIQLSTGNEWNTERRENAVLRERINDLAAQVTAMTALLEGDQSIINSILIKENRPKIKNTANTVEPAKNGEITSLADRIRALQLAAGE
jgi:chromosome segregation ATPase